MTIKKKIKLGNLTYGIYVEVEYVKNKDGIIHLELKNYKDKYFDSGNMGILLEKIEKKYRYRDKDKMNNDIPYISMFAYLVERIPFLDAISVEYTNSSDYITREEIDKYIKEFNVKIKENKDFTLENAFTWYV